MAQEIINIGATANDKSGDPLRTAFNKVNENFTELYSAVTGGVNLNQVNSDWNATSGVAQILHKPTNVSAFTNDAGYLTSTGIPSQTNNSGKYLTTNGSVLSWATVSSGSSTWSSIIGKALEDKDYGEAGVIQIAVGRA